MHRVELKQMSGGGGISRRVIDVHQLNARASPEGTEDKAADATKAVDANVHGGGSKSASRQRHHRSTMVDGSGVPRHMGVALEPSCG
jgi:hypothetical protein